MNWKASQAAGSAGSGWHPDPVDPSRLRWWDGTTWSSRVVRVEAGSEMISWHPGIGDHPQPTAMLTPSAVLGGALMTAAAANAAPSAPPLPDEPPLPTEPAAVDVSAANPVRARPRRNRRAWAMFGAAVLILAAGAGAGTAMLSGDQRPTVVDRVTYRDDAADFAVEYPAEWRIDKRTPGERVLFTIGAKDAGALDENTVSVNAGTSPGQPLVALHLLVSQATEDLTAEHPNFRLVSATETRLADAPAFRLEFVDSSVQPAERLAEVVGRTTNGRPLIVVMTVREPRTAPSNEELVRFLASITSS